MIPGRHVTEQPIAQSRLAFIDFPALLANQTLEGFFQLPKITGHEIFRVTRTPFARAGGENSR
jgi:hypothetical protein